MNSELVIDVTASEIVIALLEDNRLVGLNREKRNLQFAFGDVYLGKVKKIMPGLNAAFIDIGYERDAFLHYLDLGPQFQSFNKYLALALNHKGKLPPISKAKTEPDIDKEGKIVNVMKAGQKILVQIAKEPISTKGPRLSSEISIPGRNMVLLPFSDKVSISQKIESVEEKKRLKKLLQSIKPKNYGVIVRTAAEGKKVAVLDEELRGLLKKWECSLEKIRGNKAPSLVVSEISRISAILRDFLTVNFNKIHVNDENSFREIKEYLGSIAPEKENIVKLYRGKESIFEHFGIDKQMKSLFGRIVNARSGAYLIIEHTEALHVIDVNSGNRSKSAKDQETNALEVNILAAEEIARQLRLRDMGGIIVVDFIDMLAQENKQLLYDKMREFMSSDKTKHNILPLSKFGLMQITRQRVRPEIKVETSEKCPSCNGTGNIAPSIVFTELLENKYAQLAESNNFSKIIIKVHPYLEAYLNKGFNSIRRKWKRKYKCRLKIEPVASYHFFEYRFFDKYGDEITDY